MNDSIIEWLDYFYGNSSVVFSSLLRSMITASPGHELFVADFAKIEVAVLWWLAGNEPGLKVLREGLDPYKYQASENINKKYEFVNEDERQLGKAQVLGCGFGMGANKFQTTAWDMYRLKLSLKQSKAAVSAYREANAAVPELWESYEKAAIQATKAYWDEYELGRSPTEGRCQFSAFDKFLWIELPSTRRLAYNLPKIGWRVREYEYREEIEKPDGTVEVITEVRYTKPLETLEFMAVNSKTKKWSLERTWGGSLTENIVQAVARDLMMQAMVRLEKAGYKVLMAVHDEVISEKPKGTGSIEEFINILCEQPQWAPGLPIEAKGWKGLRYRK